MCGSIALAAARLVSVFWAGGAKFSSMLLIKAFFPRGALLAVVGTGSLVEHRAISNVGYLSRWPLADVGYPLPMMTSRACPTIFFRLSIKFRFREFHFSPHSLNMATIHVPTKTAHTRNDVLRPLL